MSGILGLVNLDGTPVDPRLLDRMTRFMKFRGPDAQDCRIDGSVGLGHALLRTTFEQAMEKQPHCLDGRLWITADARIDGRGDLVEKLRSRGREVQSDAPDVELILQAYALWDVECVQHLIGDFVFAIWDKQSRRLFCARDQFGVAPFYYAQVDHTLVFSNTLDCIRLHPAVSDGLNEQAIADLLLFRTNQNPAASTFKDIRRLPPAHTLTVQDGAARCARYWSLPEQVPITFRPAGETVAQFGTLFEQAVRDRLRTDCAIVPMSGGMDSSSIAVTAHRLLRAHDASPGATANQNRGVRAYTATLDHNLHDEERYFAGLVAAHAGIPIEYFTAPAADTLDPDDTSHLNPEPGSIAPLSTQWDIVRDGARFSRVVLSGLGGDPLLYPSQTFLLDLLRHGDLILFARGFAQQLQMQRRVPPLYILSSLKRRVGITSSPMPRWLNPAFAARLDLRQRWKEVMAAMDSQDKRRGMAEDPFWSNLLSSADAGYSSLPVKVRFPFFDVRLLDFVLTVPPIPWLVGKKILRDAMGGALPDQVLRRPKAPLGAQPLRTRARQNAIPWMDAFAATPELEPYVDRDALLQIIRAPGPLSHGALVQISMPLVLGYWLRGQESYRSRLRAQRISG